MDLGKGSRNGSVNSFDSDVPRSYKPRLRYNHMATLSNLPNGSISAQWQASLSTVLYRNSPFTAATPWEPVQAHPPSLSGCMETLTRVQNSDTSNQWPLQPGVSIQIYY